MIVISPRYTKREVVKQITPHSCVAACIADVIGDQFPIGIEGKRIFQELLIENLGLYTKGTLLHTAAKASSRLCSEIHTVLGLQHVRFAVINTTLDVAVNNALLGIGVVLALAPGLLHGIEGHAVRLLGGQYPLDQVFSRLPIIDDFMSITIWDPANAIPISLNRKRIKALHSAAGNQCLLIIPPKYFQFKRHKPLERRYK